MIRRLMFWALILIFLWVLFREYDEIILFFETLAHGDLAWVLLAAALVVVYHLLFAFSYQAAFGAAGVIVSAGSIIPVMLASLFVGTVAPGGGATSLAIFVDDAVRRGYSAARAMGGLMIQMIADFSSLSILMGAGLVYMQRLGQVNTYSLIGAGIILGITLGMLAVVLVGMWFPGLLQRLFQFIRYLANRPAAWFKKPDFLEPEWAVKSAADFIDAAVAMVRSPRWVIRALVFMLAANLIDIAVLTVLFHSFGYEIGFSQVVAGFSMINVAMMVSPVPEGIGVVEGAMVYVFDALAVPWEFNLTTSLAYRGLTFWLPLVLGLTTLHRVRTFKSTQGANPGDDADLSLTLKKINTLTDTQKLLQRNLDLADIIATYSEDDSKYDGIYSTGGSMHVSLSNDHRYQKDGYFEQARMVNEIIQAAGSRQVLELCSGKGFNSIFLAKQNPHVQFTGVDLVEWNIQVAQAQSFEIDNARFQIGNIESLEFPAEAFDLVFCVDSLFLVSNLEKALSEVRRVLKPGGRLIVFDYFRKQELDNLSSNQRDAMRMVEIAFSIMSPTSTGCFLEAAGDNGVKALKVEELSHKALPCVRRFYRLVNLAFMFPPATRLLPKILSPSLVDQMVGWELTLPLFKADLLGYYWMDLIRLRDGTLDGHLDRA